jgi:chaperone modulatory protein CbpM
MSKKIFLLNEAARECGVEERVIVHFVQKQWIIPARPTELDEQDVARARLIQELQEIFGVNDEGIPIILHLVDQLVSFQRSVRRYSDELHSGAL